MLNKTRAKKNGTIKKARNATYWDKYSEISGFEDVKRCPVRWPRYLRHIKAEYNATRVVSSFKTLGSLKLSFWRIINEISCVESQISCLSRNFI